MITREELRESLIHECNICLHLYDKIPSGGFDFRFSAGQRSTIELLRYLAMTGIAPMKTFMEGNWTPWKEYQERLKEMTAEEFPARMREQIAEIRAFFDEVTEDDLRTRRAKLPIGTEVSMAVGVLETSLKWLVGYRMQLFLQVKASGVEGINTVNNWIGMDWKPDDAAGENSTADVAEESAA
ncbi:MAG: hypothetical protein JWQ98_1691 [Chlorobi bacterium]|nr:hypothetical protein [Chlorobiota bacterium]